MCGTLNEREMTLVQQRSKTNLYCFLVSIRDDISPTWRREIHGVVGRWRWRRAWMLRSRSSVCWQWPENVNRTRVVVVGFAWAFPRPVFLVSGLADISANGALLARERRRGTLYSSDRRHRWHRNDEQLVAAATFVDRRRVGRWGDAFFSPFLTSAAVLSCLPFRTRLLFFLLVLRFRSTTMRGAPGKRPTPSANCVAGVTDVVLSSFAITLSLLCPHFVLIVSGFLFHHAGRDVLDWDWLSGHWLWMKWSKF